MNKDFISEQTIAAISTPEGEGGISVIRISGIQSENIINKIFKSRAENELFESRKLYHGKIINPSDNSVIDSVLIAIMRAPNSYTGEDVVEIFTHGGYLIPQKILKLITSLDSRVAMPGEFTQRAFLNGKMDLAQAEAVVDIISAQSEISLKQANLARSRIFR